MSLKELLAQRVRAEPSQSDSMARRQLTVSILVLEVIPPVSHSPLRKSQVGASVHPPVAKKKGMKESATILLPIPTTPTYTPQRPNWPVGRLALQFALILPRVM